jgi:transposase
MMGTYSMDLRDRVVAACDDGYLLREEIAEEFGISSAWIRRLLQRRRECGDYGPKKTKRGRKPAFSGEALQRLDKLVEAQPDATLEELRDRSGVSCSLVTMFKTLERLDYRRKKRRFGPLSKIAT